jgi:hypothetical protein
MQNDEKGGSLSRGVEGRTSNIQHRTRNGAHAKDAKDEMDKKDENGIGCRGACHANWMNMGGRVDARRCCGWPSRPHTAALQFTAAMALGRVIFQKLR